MSLAESHVRAGFQTTHVFQGDMSMDISFVMEIAAIPFAFVYVLRFNILDFDDI